MGSIYDLMNVGRWEIIFKKEFPEGHFLPITEAVVLTQDVCDKFSLSIYGTILKHKGLVPMYSQSGEPLQLKIGNKIQTLRLPSVTEKLHTSPDPNVPVWDYPTALRYIMESWFSALKTLDKKGKTKDLIFALSRTVHSKSNKNDHSGIRITYSEANQTYKAVVLPSFSSYTQVTELVWDDVSITLKVGTQSKQSTGITTLFNNNPLYVPTKYIVLTYLMLIVDSHRGIEDVDYREFNGLLRESTLWLNSNAIGEYNVYGMRLPPDSTRYVKDSQKGMNLNIDMHSDSNKYPLFFLRKLSPQELGGDSSRKAIQDAHNLGLPFLSEKNGGIDKPYVSQYKGVNNCFIGFNAKKGLYYNYLADPKKPEKTFNRIHTGTGGIVAEMDGLERSNIGISNIDGSITYQYGYPLKLFVCQGRGYGGNSGVIPVHPSFHIPYRVRKQFMCTVYTDNIPRNSPIEKYLKQKAKLYSSNVNDGLTLALASYIREQLEQQVVPLLKENPNYEWKDKHLLTLFKYKDEEGQWVGKPLKVFYITGNNRRYRFHEGQVDTDSMVSVGLNCVHISADMYFYGTPGQPFKLRMLGGKATTLPCEFKTWKKDSEDTLVPYHNHIDALQSNECIKGPALWWLAYAQSVGTKDNPSILYPNEGLMRIPSGEVVNFLEPNNGINKWLEENAEELFIDYEINNEVLNVLRQEPEFLQEWETVNPNADIQILKIDGNGALVRERVIGVYVEIPLGFIELSTAAEKVVGNSTLTSQQFAVLGMLNHKLLEGLAQASSWKRDVVAKMIETYITAPELVSKIIKGGDNGNTHQLFLIIQEYFKKQVKEELPDIADDALQVLSLAHSRFKQCLSSDKELMQLIDNIFPEGFIYSLKGIELPIYLPVLQIYAQRDTLSPDVIGITPQVLAVIRKLAWAYVEIVDKFLETGVIDKTFKAIKDVEKDINLNGLNASIRGWMKSLLGDSNSSSKILAALGRITACGQATVKTSHLPSCSNQKVEVDGVKYSIPVMYIHPDDDLLHVLFGNDIPDTSNVNEPYFIACTRTPLGFWVFGRLIISEQHGWLNHITMNCVIAQLSSETDGDGDIMTIIPVTQYDDSLGYVDIATYNSSYVGYLGYGLHGKDSTLMSFFETKGKWGDGKHPFRTHQHPLIPIKGYEHPDFVGIMDKDIWANNAHYTQLHYRINVGTGYSAYSYICFAASKVVEEFRTACLKSIPNVTNTNIIQYMNDIQLLNALNIVDKNTKQALISKCKTAICYMAGVSLTSRGLYEGMGLSGFKAKAYSVFSLYQALTNNPNGKVVSYLKDDFSKEFYLYTKESTINQLSKEDFNNLVKDDKGKIKTADGVKYLTGAIFPKEILNLCIRGTSSISSYDEDEEDDEDEKIINPDLVYDPIENSYMTYQKGTYIGMHTEVIGIIRKAALWGFIHSRIKQRKDHGGSDEDFINTVCYRVLRDFTSGSLGDDVYSMMDFGEDSSVSLLLLSLIRDGKEGNHWMNKVKELIPNDTLRDMVLRALPLMEKVYYYKLGNLSN